MVIGISLIFPSNLITANAYSIQKTGKLITISSQDRVISSHEEKMKIAFLTDGLLSDAGWGAFGYNAAQALQEKYSYMVDFQENVSLMKIEETLREYA